jgi:hypothetical protein
MWNKVKRLFKREADYAQLEPIHPKVAPDPAVAARLANKQTDYVPGAGFLKDRRQEKNE